MNYLTSGTVEFRKLCLIKTFSNLNNRAAKSIWIKYTKSWRNARRKWGNNSEGLRKQTTHGNWYACQYKIVRQTSKKIDSQLIELDSTAQPLNTKPEKKDGWWLTPQLYYLWGSIKRKVSHLLKVS